MREAKLARQESKTKNKIPKTKYQKQNTKNE
jgi:hypothetical protein